MKKGIIILLLVAYALIISFYKIILFKIENYIDGKIFIDDCLNNINIKTFDYYPETPIISVVIPVYNCENTILNSITSIQNQNISNFEMILINDFSTDNTSNLLQNLKKKDKRVKIINNKVNMGTLYSRCIGTLISKGEYIFALDNDDMIFGKDIFYYTYKIAKQKNKDIVGFKSVRAHNYSENIRNLKDSHKYLFPNNLTVYQPELSTWQISINGKFHPHDVTLWGKIIRSKIYIKAINLLGIKRYSLYLSWAEDTSMNFIIFNIAESYIFIHKYGIFHLSGPTTATSTQPINNNFFGLLFWLEIIFDFSKNNEDKNYSVSAALYIINYFQKDKSVISENNISYLNKIIIKIIKSKYINEKNKKELINKSKIFLS